MTRTSRTKKPKKERLSRTIQRQTTHDGGRARNNANNDSTSIKITPPKATIIKDKRDRSITKAKPSTIIKDIPDNSITKAKPTNITKAKPTTITKDKPDSSIIKDKPNTQACSSNWRI